MRDLWYSGKPPRRLLCPDLQDLILEEGREVTGSNEPALGSGIIALIGTARSGKTTLAYQLIDYAIHHTNRPIFLAKFPQVVIEEGLPEHWKGRVEARDSDEIHTVGQDENAIWLLDDAAANFNSRSSMRKGQVSFSRAAGVISHLGGGQTVIFTSQSAQGVDLSFFRFTEVVTVTRYMSGVGLRTERSAWSEDLSHAQYLLRMAHGNEGSKRLRDFYVVISSSGSGGKTDFTVVPFVKPKWLFDGLGLKSRDMLSRPFRYMEQRQIAEIIQGPQPRPRGRPKKKKEGNE